MDEQRRWIVGDDMILMSLRADEARPRVAMLAPVRVAPGFELP